MGGIHKFNQLGSFDQCTRTDFEVTFVHDQTLYMYDNFNYIILNSQACDFVHSA